VQNKNNLITDRQIGEQRDLSHLQSIKEGLSRRRYNHLLIFCVFSRERSSNISQNIY
jgi:hypothetical protein